MINILVLQRGVCSFLVLSLMLFLSFPVHAETIKVGGSGSALGVASLLTKEFQAREPGLVVTVVPNLGSAGSVKALVAGAIEVALTSRPLTEEEQRQGLVAYEYGKTPFVLVANTPGITNLTIDELTAIYAGKQTRWPNGQQVRLVLRPAGDSDNLLLATISPAMEHALAAALLREGMIVADTDQDVARAIQHVPGTLGGISLALLTSEHRPLTPLAINGVIPSIDTLANNTYPYCKSMFIVTKNKTSSVVTQFVNFVQSTDGRRILTENGHLVANR